MTRQDAVKWVLSAVESAKTHEVLVPNLPAFRLMDLATAMNKQYTVIGLPAYEKLHESMNSFLSSDQAGRMSVSEIKEALRSV
jgi:FlaA1/EpsC-like NDP-sugar epimerase